MRVGLALRASLVGGAVAVSCVSARGATLTIQDSLDDFEAQRRSDTGVYIASENFANGSRAGFQSNFNGSGAQAPGGITSLYFFQLPTLAAGQTIESANFSVGTLPDTATTATTPSFNGDLYALGFVNSIAKDAAAAEKFFYLGNTAQTSLPDVAGGPTVGGTVSRVADDFLDASDFVPNGGTATDADSADITAYVRDLYANQATNGFMPGTSFLVLRVNPDADTLPTSGTQRYLTAFQGTAANGGAGTAANRPLVTLEVVPEPTGVAILLVGGLGVLGARRRRA